ncbi:hypothetical protein HK102_004420, partial [Quaeritorhiza haematococci]
MRNRHPIHLPLLFSTVALLLGLLTTVSSQPQQNAGGNNGTNNNNGGNGRVQVAGELNGELGDASRTIYTEHEVMNQPCVNPQVRREWRSLTTEEQQAYIDAFNAFRQPGTSVDGTASRLEDYVRTHILEYDTAHNVNTFLSWHRMFIRVFELELQKTHPNITIPFWDWAADSSMPDRSPLFAVFGGNGDNPNDLCVTTGVLATSDRNRCFRREFDGPDNTLTPFANELVIANIIFGSQDYVEFRTNLEFEHNIVHNNIGGDNGDMATPTSPRDPLFWLHHSNVDRFWALWQALHPNNPGTNQNGTSRTFLDYRYDLTTSITQGGLTDLCYVYGNGIIAESSDFDDPNPTANITRTNITQLNRRDLPRRAPRRFATHTDPNKLPYPQPLPERFLTRMGHNVSHIRSLEARDRKLIDA